MIDEHFPPRCPRLRGVAVLEVHGPIAGPEAKVGAERRGDVHLAAPQRVGEFALRRRERLIVGLQQRALVERIEREARRERLAGNRVRAAGLEPVKMNRPAAAMLRQIVLQPVLHGEIRRMRRVRARHHDRGVDVAEHGLVERPRFACALDQHRRLERLRPRLRQHFDDAEVDAAGAHHLVANMRQQFDEQARMRDRHHALAGLQRELLDDALRHCRVIEGEPRLRERVRPGENDQNDESEDALHAGHYRLTVARSFQGRG